MDIGCYVVGCNQAATTEYPFDYDGALRVVCDEHYHSIADTCGVDHQPPRTDAAPPAS
jgi:hypothetical protein